MRVNADKIQKRIISRDDRQYGIINYDVDNAYPQRVIDIVNGSSQAKNCLKVYKKFILGDGFEDEQFWKSKINSDGETVDQLFRKVVDDFSHFGFALHFNFNAMGERVEVNHVPFAHCRLQIAGEDGKIKKIAVYNDWARTSGKTIKKENIDFIDVYNPDPNIVIAQIKEAGGIDKYKGQILYYGAGGELKYPLSSIDSELEDAETDGQIKLFKYRNISGSFMASHMLVTYGKFEDGTIQNSGALTSSTLLVQQGQTQAEMFKETIKGFQGAENFNRIMHVEADTPEEKPELIPFTHQNSDKLFEWHETSTQDNIRRNFVIPEVFLNAIPGSLGLNSQLNDAIAFYNKITYDERKVLTEQFSKIFSTWKPQINVSGNYEIIELTKIISLNVEVKDVLDVVSSNEKRILAGLPEQKSVQNDGITLAQKIGVGGTQSMMAILTDTIMTREQKAGALKILFNLTDEQIQTILPIPKT